jgi:hypothetical protein
MHQGTARREGGGWSPATCARAQRVQEKDHTNKPSADTARTIDANLLAFAVKCGAVTYVLDWRVMTC